MAEMSPLRRRMIEDMTVRNLSPATQRSYVYAVAKFSRHFGPRRSDWAWRTFAPFRSIWRPRAFPGRRSTRSFAPCGSSMASPLAQAEIPERIPTPASRASCRRAQRR